MTERKPKHPCPKCGRCGRQTDSVRRTRTVYFQCAACAARWNERVVDGKLHVSYRVTLVHAFGQ